MGCSVRQGRTGAARAAFQAHAQDAEGSLRQRLLTLVGAGRDVVVDFAFCRRSDRDRYERLIKEAGGTWALPYLKAEPAELRGRLDLRARRFDADAVFPVTPELLDAY
jgi:predicted kinase